MTFPDAVQQFDSISLCREMEKYQAIRGSEEDEDGEG